MKKEQRIRFLGVHIFRGKMSLNKAWHWRLRQFFFKKNWRMRIVGARIFLSFLAGKLKIDESYPDSKLSQPRQLL